MTIRKRIPHLSLAVATATVALGVSVPLHAQVAILAEHDDPSDFDLNSTRTGYFANDRNVSVKNHPHPGYDTIPFRFGSLLVTPSLQASLEYNDNLLASSAVSEKAAVLSLVPTVFLKSDWSRNYLQAYANADIDRYTGHSAENRNQWQLGTRGRFDIDQATSIQAGGSAERKVELRTAATAPATDRPISYNDEAVFLGATKAFNRLRVIGYGNFDNKTYNDATQNGIAIDQKFRNRETLSFNGQAEYALLPGYSLLVTAQVDHRNSTHGTVINPQRDSNGIDIQAGASFDIGGLATGSLTAGYIRRKYDNPFYGNVSDPTFAANIEYYATPLITVRLAAGRTVEDSTVGGAGGFLATTVAAHADYEFQRNVIFTAGGGLGFDNFKGIDRRDDRRNADASVRWLLNRALEVGVRYNLENQASSGLQPGRRFTVNRIGVSLTYRGNQ